MLISISICPTDLVFANGDQYDAESLLDSIRGFINQRHPDARIGTLQVGGEQGHAWSTIDGDNDAGQDLLSEFFEKHGNDPSLFR